jgi:hypothetical protein
MKVSFTQPEKQLSPYVALIWVFESSLGVPLADSRIKEFKRFTGFTPQQYTGIVNEFGRAFHAKQ